MAGCGVVPPVPETPGVADDAGAGLRTANARLRVLLAERDAQAGELRAQVAELRAQVADLAARLSQNSKNSSRPPSSDGMAKPAPAVPRPAHPAPRAAPATAHSQYAARPQHHQPHRAFQAQAALHHSRPSVINTTRQARHTEPATFASKRTDLSSYEFISGNFEVIPGEIPPAQPCRWTPRAELGSKAGPTGYARIIAVYCRNVVQGDKMS